MGGERVDYRKTRIVEREENARQEVGREESGKGEIEERSGNVE